MKKSKLDLKQMKVLSKEQLRKVLAGGSFRCSYLGEYCDHVTFVCCSGTCWGTGNPTAPYVGICRSI